MSVQASDEVQRGRELLGLPVYSISEGTLLGSVDTLLVRRTDRTIPLIRVKSGSFSRSYYVTFANLRTLGPDVVLVDNRGALLDDLPANDMADLDTDLPGRPVLTPSGENIGQVDGFSMDTIGGRIASLRVKTHAGFLSRVASLVKDNTVQVPDEMIHSIGPDAVILTPEGVARLNPGAGGA